MGIFRENSGTTKDSRKSGERQKGAKENRVLIVRHPRTQKVSEAAVLVSAGEAHRLSCPNVVKVAAVLAMVGGEMLAVRSPIRAASIGDEWTVEKIGELTDLGVSGVVVTGKTTMFTSFLLH